MAELKQFERLIRILQQFTIRREVTVDFLYSLFGGQVSKRTLQRDLLALSAAGIPLVDKRREHGKIYWSLDSTYLKFIPMTLGLDEFISSLLLKRLSTIFKNTSIEKDIQALDKKIEQLIPEEVLAVRDSLEELEPFFGTLQFGYVDYTDYGEQLRSFLYAAINHQVCEVVYRAGFSSKPKKFLIHPYSLLLHYGAFYGIVFQPKHKEYIYLLIHRIEKIIVQERTFKRKSDFDLKSFISHAFGVWHDRPQKVRIQFYPEVARKIEERVWQKEQKIEKLNDGSIILELKVAITSELVSWILRWGSFARVIEPANLVEMMKTEIYNIYRRYI